MVMIPIMLSCESPSTITLGGHTNPNEIHSWSPPSPQELAIRRERQRVLDDLEREIQKRFLFQEDVKEEERALLASLGITKAQIASLEPAVQKQVESFKKDFKEIQTELAKLETSGKEINTGIAIYKKSLIPTKKTTDYYITAIRWFQKGDYPKSIAAFKKMLTQDPPRFLKDNIYFGLGTAFYKMKKWDSALKHFKTVIKDYPMGNKWPVSHLMLALIYNKRNENSRALYALESALERHLSQPTRKLIERLLKSIQEEGTDVSS